MLAASLGFAAMGASTHALGSRCDWLLVALVRAVFMFLFAASLARLAGVPLVLWRPRTLWIRSLAGSFSLVCNFYALARLPVADSLTLSNTYPLWIVLMAALLLRQWPRWAEWIGLACGLLGVWLIERPHLAGDRTASLVALMAAVSTAVALLGLNRLGGVASQAVVAHFAGVAAIVAAIGVAFRPGALAATRLDPATLALLAAVAVSGTVSQLCLTRAYATGRPARLSVIGLSQVAFALVLDLVFWGRRPDPLALLGFALVLAPTAWLGGLAGARLAAVGSRATSPPPSSAPPSSPPGEAAEGRRARSSAPASPPAAP
jgi:drug/metabolite transporter (DMT)-like permease